MLKNEWKSLLKNKILLIVIAAVILIPVIYAGLFLKSMWDPYGNLDKLPVAVVNLDKKADYEGTPLDIGREMTEALKENDSLDFYFVDSAEASRGLANGTYYMVITIPEDFFPTRRRLWTTIRRKWNFSARQTREPIILLPRWARAL